MSRKFRSTISGKKRLASLTMAALWSCQILAAVPGWAAPTVGVVTTGTAAISQTGAVTNINQSTQAAAINWQGFSIGSNETVNFNQPNSSAVTLNRVVGNESSVINGALNATGQVFLVNSNGILFGQGSSVNTGGFVASTLGISDEDFNAGKYIFKSGSTSGSVINMGTITAKDGGYVGLLGNSVSNQGVITATKGTVALASGNAVTLNFNGDSMVSVTVDEGVLNALVENKQAVYADGGTVILTASAAEDLLSAQVNNSGIIQAQSIDDLKGSITLKADGGTATVGGTLDASAPTTGNGGFIETSGDSVKVADTATVTTKSAQGESGTWLIDPDGYVIGQSGDMTGAALTKALTLGNVTIASTQGSGTDGNIDVNDTVTWSANTLTLNATNNIYVNNVMTATGTASFAANYGHVLDAGGNPTATVTAGYDADHAGIGTDLKPYGIYMLQSALLVGSNGYTGRIDFAGTGTVSLNGKAYTVIDTIEDWRALFNKVGDTYVFSDPAGNYVIGSDFGGAGYGYNIGTFSGNLNGFGHALSGVLTYETGLIDTIAAGATVSNLGFRQSYVLSDKNTATTTYAAGMLANYNRGDVLNCCITGGGNVLSIFAANATNENDSVEVVGGLVGVNYGLISECYSTAGVYALNIASGTMTGIAGGLVGINAAGGTIIDSSASASNLGYTTTTGASVGYVGGFVGVNSGTIERSYSTSSIRLTDGNSTVGSFAGYNSGTIEQCYAGYRGANTASNGSILAGFVYENAIGGKITDCYTDSFIINSISATYWDAGFVYINAGTISNAYAIVYSRAAKNAARYAFVCQNTGTISNAYWYGATYTTGTNTAITNTTDSGGKAYATQLTADQVNSLASYTGFSTAIWGSSANGYPILTNLMVYISNTGVTYGTATNDVTTLGLTARGLQGSSLDSKTILADTVSIFTVTGTENGYLNAGSYAVEDILSCAAYAKAKVKGLITVTPKTLTLSSGAVENKTYDGNATAVISDTLTVSGYAGTQTLDIDYTSATFADENAGKNKTVTLSYTASDGTNGGKVSNYVIVYTTTATITPRTVTAALTADDKTYDGTATVVSSYSLENTIFGDDLALSYSAAFSDANAGEDKTVTASGLTLTGGDSGNYVLASATAETTADIDKRVLVLSGITKLGASTEVSAENLIVRNAIDGDEVPLSGSVTIKSSDESGVQHILGLDNLEVGNGNYTLAGASGTVTVNTTNMISDAVVSGSADIKTVGDTTTITQYTDSAIIDWLRFNIAENETVNFVQPSSSAIVLNRVVGDEASLIEGVLTANGLVFLINSNGILFAPGSTVNVGGLVASTLDITNSDFLDDDIYGFKALSDSGSVSAKGSIEIADGGLVALIGADGVTHTGTTTAEGGDALLVSTEQVSLTLASGNTLADYAISDLSGAATVKGSIRLAATGGVGGTLETAGSSLAIDEDFSLYTGIGGTWSLSLPSLSVGDNGTFSTGFVTENLARRSLALNAIGGDLDLNTALDLTTDNTLTLSATDEVNINHSITVSGVNAGLAINAGGDYTLADGVVIDFAGANAGLAINGNAYTLIRSMAEIEALDDATGTASGYYALAGDIDASGTTYTSAVISTLSGILTGLGYTLSNLAINAGEGSTCVGLVGTALAGSSLRDLVLSNANVTGYMYVGTLVGYSSAVVKNVTASGTVTGALDGVINRHYGSENLGGLIGYQYYGSVTDAHADVTLTGVNDPNSLSNSRSSLIGGIIGTAQYTTVTDSSASGVVTGNGGMGGLIGKSTYTDVSNCFATGDVTAFDPDGDGPAGVSGASGGLIGGFGGGTLRDSYATGDVTGNTSIGGLVGATGTATVINCYATGDVTSNETTLRDNVGENIGGLIGQAYDTDIINCYATGKVAGISYVGGLVGWATNGSTVSNCYATGDVSTILRGFWSFGGLVGYMRDGSIADSYATGNVEGNINVGGLVGEAFSMDISGSHATGTVTGAEGAGGLVGDFGYGSIRDSYATGDVYAYSFAGGLLAGAGWSTLTNVWASGNVYAANGYAGGLIGGSTGNIINHASSIGNVVNDRPSSGEVEGTTGALIGTSGDDVISDSSATGSVTEKGQDINTLIGANQYLNNRYGKTVISNSTYTDVAAVQAAQQQAAEAAQQAFESSAVAQAAPIAGQAAQDTERYASENGLSEGFSGGGSRDEMSGSMDDHIVYADDGSYGAWIRSISADGVEYNLMEDKDSFGDAADENLRKKKNQ